MKTFKIVTIHDVYIDDFEEGEGKHVNCYDIESTVKAESVKEAIKEHYEKHLGFSFSFEHCNYDEEEKNRLDYSNLVDSENSEANEEEKKLWKKGKKTLYANNTTCTVYELTPVELFNINQ